MNEDEMVDWFSGNPPIGTWVLVWVREPEYKRGMYIGKCDHSFSGLTWKEKETGRVLGQARDTHIAWTYLPKPPYEGMPAIRQEAIPL